MSNTKINFISDITLKNFEKIQWVIESPYDIEFYDGIITHAILLNKDSNINKFIDPMPTSNDIVFADFNFFLDNQENIHDDIQNNIPKKCLFTFCFKSSVYIFLLTTTEIDNQFIQFLSSKNDLHFVGLNTQNIEKQLKNIFGSDFSINLDDFSNFVLKSDKAINLYDIINEHIGKPKIEIDINKFHAICDIENLYIPQVIIPAFKVFSLSLLYSNLTKGAEPTKTPQIINNNIQFSAEFTPDDFKLDWNVGESYNIEFYKGVFTPVYLIDSNSDLTEYLQKISIDPIIFVDFKSVQTYVYQKKLTAEEKEEVPFICLFSFYCSSGVYIIKQTNLTANYELKKFLSSESGHRFVGLNIEGVLRKLSNFFKPDFSINIEDVFQTRLTQKNDPTNFHDLVVKYYKQPAAEFKNKKVNFTLWHKNPLKMTSIIYAAFKVYSLALCFPNFPSEKVQEPPKEKLKEETNKKQKKKDVIIYSSISPSEVKSQPEICKKGEIHFTSDSKFDDFKNHTWLVGDSYDIEFFSGTLTPVVLLDASCDITDYVNKMKLDEVIFFDLEYVNMTENVPPICLYQFCCSSGTFLFKQTRIEVNDQMRNFLAFESGNKFVGKGSNNDVLRLKQYFGEDFEINLEDIERTRLLPYDNNANFDEMVLKFAGKAEAQFKDKKMSRSNWSLLNLSMKQVIYSAFDVVSLYRCYPCFPPVRAFTYIPPEENINHLKIDIKKKFAEFVSNSENQEKSVDEVNSIWNLNPNLVTEAFEINANLIFHVVHESMKVVLGGHKISCKLCGSKYIHFTGLIDHFRDKHFSEESCGSTDQKVDFKELFLHYLFNTGRVILGNNSCILCDTLFDSKSELENHCWNAHFDFLNEFLQIKGKGKAKEEKEDEKENEKEEE